MAGEAAKDAERLRESEPPVPTGEVGELSGDETTSHSATPISEATISRSGSCDVTAVEKGDTASHSTQKTSHH